MKDRLLAQLSNPVLPGQLGGQGNASPDIGVSAAGRFIGALAGLLFVVAAIAAFFYLILGGLQWITSGGDKTGLETARNKITNAILGLIIVAAAWAVWLLAGGFIGIDFRNIPFPSVI